MHESNEHPVWAPQSHADLVNPHRSPHTVVSDTLSGGPSLAEWDQQREHDERRWKRTG